MKAKALGARLAGVLLSLVLLHCCHTSTDTPAEGALLYISRGRVAAVDTTTLAVSMHGTFASDAPTVELDSDGLLWAKTGPNRLTGLDPGTGKVVASVPLRYRAFDHVLMPNGKAYVTHNTVTSAGFTVSVVDTTQRLLVRELDGIAGLRTDLIHDDRYVYLAVVGVEGADDLLPRLYRMDSETDALKEIRSFPERGYHWKLAVTDVLLFVFFVPNTGSGLAPRADALEVGSLELVRTIPLTPLIGESRALSDLLVNDELGILVGRDAEKHFEAVVTDAELSGVVRRFPLEGTASRVLGVVHGVLVYVDTSAARDVSLRFYDIEGGEEVKSADISSGINGER